MIDHIAAHATESSVRRWRCLRPAKVSTLRQTVDALKRARRVTIATAIDVFWRRAAAVVAVVVFVVIGIVLLALSRRASACPYCVAVVG